MFDSVAAIAVITGSALFVAVPESTTAEKNTVAFSYMTNIGNTKRNFAITKEKSVADVALQSKPTSFLGLRYGVSGMIDQQGTYMFGPGVGKTVDIGKFDLTLFIYPSYSSIHGEDRKTMSGNFNWRTTFDATYRLDKKTKMGIGLMHISNGGYRDPNNGLEALRFTLGYDF